MSRILACAAFVLALMLALPGSATASERRADGLPGGVSLLGPAWSDEAIWAAAARITGGAALAPPEEPASARRSA